MYDTVTQLVHLNLKDLYPVIIQATGTTQKLSNLSSAETVSKLTLREFVG